MRWWRLALVVLAAALAAAGATLLAVAVNVATGGTARWFPTMDQHPLPWTAGATAAIFVAAVSVWAAQRWYERALKALVPAVQRPEPWVVDRPAEVDQIVSALRRRGGTVGITTAVHGAGGFGKTTVAKIVRADRRVLRRFKGRVYWVTLGRDVTKQTLAGLVNGLIGQLEPGRAVTFTDPRQAGEQLAAMLAAGPRRLVVLDDVWSDEHLAAFPPAGRCARLVTTRIPSLAGADSVPVRVDQMSQEQALKLLGAGLPMLPEALAAGLVKETGRWPLLLRLVNKILADQAKSQPDVTAAARDLLSLLSRGEVLQVDNLTGAAAQQLDVSDPDQRNKAVRATIQASTSLLGEAEHDRLAELAIFAEDETIPVTLLAPLWQATGGLDQMASRALCARLADLALVTLIPAADGGTITLHDVIRDYLRDHLGATRQAQVNRVLLEAVAAGLPRAPAPAGNGGEVTAWWELPDDARYLQEHLIEHMLDAGQTPQAEELATDLRWAGARLERSAPAGPYADLALIGTPRTERLRRVLGQAAHLLAPTDPPHSRIDILYSRVGHDPDWGAQARALARGRKLPALINRWPLPDLPDPALRLTLTGHSGSVTALAIAPDGTWLAAADIYETVRIWDTATGLERATLPVSIWPVRALAIAPDGTWLAAGGDDRPVRIWDMPTGRQRATLGDYTGPVAALAIAPDGTWLATADHDGIVRIWDMPGGRQRAALTGSTGRMDHPAFAPDGTWLAAAGGDGTVRIWDMPTGRQRATLTGHHGPVSALAIAPDGTWLATAAYHPGPERSWVPGIGDRNDGPVWVWDAATGQQRAILAGHSGVVSVSALAIAPDGTWLAIGGGEGTVRIWDTAATEPGTTTTLRTRQTSAVAFSPDGTWLATVSGDQAVRIWDPGAGDCLRTLTGHSGLVSAPAIAPDGTWLATAAGDGTVQIWDMPTGWQRATLTGHPSTVDAMAIAPDGTWLATVSGDQAVRIWDAATGRQRATFTGQTGPMHVLAIAPDGTWLAAADRAVRIWDTPTGQERAIFTAHSAPVVALAIAQDGTWLASASRNGTVRIWDMPTGRERATLTGHLEPRTLLAIAPDNTWLAAVGHDGTVRIWDAATGQQRATLTGSTGKVCALAAAPDSTRLAAAGDDDDGTMRIWDTATGRIQAVMRMDHPLTDCAWSPSGQLLAVAGAGGLYCYTFKP